MVVRSKPLLISTLKTKRHLQHGWIPSSSLYTVYIQSDDQSMPVSELPLNDIDLKVL
jgi:hypothetical protein